MLKVGQYYYESGNNWQWGSWKSAGSLLESFQIFA